MSFASAQRNGFRKIAPDDLTQEAIEHFAQTHGLSRERSLLEYARNTRLNQLLYEWQSAALLFERCIELLWPHKTPGEIVLFLRDTAEAYAELLSSGLLLQDGIRLLFLANDLATALLAVPAIRAEIAALIHSDHSARLRFALYEDILPPPLLGLVLRHAHSSSEWQKAFPPPPEYF